jgi:hypothetical protein
MSYILKLSEEMPSTLKLYKQQSPDTAQKMSLELKLLEQISTILNSLSEHECHQLFYKLE